MLIVQITRLSESTCETLNLFFFKNKSVKCDGQSGLNFFEKGICQHSTVNSSPIEFSATVVKMYLCS